MRENLRLGSMRAGSNVNSNRLSLSHKLKVGGHMGGSLYCKHTNCLSFGSSLICIIVNIIT